MHIEKEKIFFRLQKRSKKIDMTVELRSSVVTAVHRDNNSDFLYTFPN